MVLTWLAICLLTIADVRGSRIPVESFSLVSLDAHNLGEPVLNGYRVLRRGLSTSGVYRSIELPNNVELKLNLEGETLAYTLNRAVNVFSSGSTIYVQSTNGVDTYDAASLNSSTVNYKGENIVLSMSIGHFNGVIIHNSSIVNVNYVGHQLELETEHEAFGYCGTDANYSIDPVEEIPAGEISGHVHTHKRRELVERWTNCYPDDSTKRAFRLGLAITNNLYSNELGSNPSVAKVWLEGVVAKASTVYSAQMNIELTIGTVFIETDSTPASSCRPGNVCEWRNAACNMDMRGQLRAFTRWNKAEIPVADRSQGLWHLFNDCIVQSPKILGLAYIGVLCQQPYNTGITEFTGENGIENDGTWRPFAHEIGHNFGAFHSFEEGQGTTGGIMDYGDFRLDNEYQFNTKYRQAEMCKEISANIMCSAFSILETISGTPSPTPNPTLNPTRNPTSIPTRQPTRNPTRHPTSQPTRKNPTRNPTSTRSPTRDPTRTATRNPTRNPARGPTRNPTNRPTNQPSRRPTAALPRRPTFQPTTLPLTISPTVSDIIVGSLHQNPGPTPAGQRTPSPVSSECQDIQFTRIFQANGEEMDCPSLYGLCNENDAVKRRCCRTCSRTLGPTSPKCKDLHLRYANGRLAHCSLLVKFCTTHFSVRQNCPCTCANAS